MRPQSRTAQMKTILMLTVGLILAGCGSTENHVRNDGVAPTSAGPLEGPGDRSAVDPICACACRLNPGVARTCPGHAAQDRCRIAFDWPTVNDPSRISSTIPAHVYDKSL